MQHTSHKLKNGLETIISPIRGTEAVTVLFLVRAGSKYETREESGLSHFLEHMFFKGTKKRVNTFAISEALDKVGGIYNAFTGKEYTGFYIKLAHPYLELALDVLSDMLISSTFKAKEVEREKGVILEEIKLYQDTPTSYVSELFENLLYGDTPAGQDIIGTPETVSSFTDKDIKKYLKGHYSSSNSLLIVSGKVDPDKTLKLTEKYFSAFPKNKTLEKPAVNEKQSKPGFLKFKKKTDQTHLCLGVRSFDLFSPEKYVLALLDVVLGGGMSSRLFINVRERHGLAYYIRSGQETYTDTGYFMVQAGIAHQNIKKVVKLILKEFDQLKKTPIKADELKKAKDYLKGITLLHLETSDAVALYLAKQKLLRGKILLPEEVFDLIDSVNEKKLKEISQNIFTNKNLNLALISPSQISSEIASKLLNLT